MGLYIRPGSKFWHLYVEGATKPRVNTKIPIGTTTKAKRESRQKAQAVYHQLMLDRASDAFGLTRQKPARTFLAQREWYQAHVSALKRSAKNEQSKLRQLGTHFDDEQLRDLTPTRIREWRQHLAKTLTAATINRLEALLRHILKTAIPDYLTHHPLQGLKGLRIAPTDTRVLSHEEETRLLAALTSPQDRAIVICALDTLLRLSNVTNLTRAQDHGTYLYSDTKAGAVRVPISKRLRAALDALPDTSRYYFPAYALHSAWTTEMFMAACDRANVVTTRAKGGVTFHCLRHTGATRMLAAGVDVKTVMRLGGWRSLRVLERYLHPTDDAALAAVEAIGAI